MPSLRCGHCQKLFQYQEQIIALKKTEAGDVALREVELEAGTVEGAFEPVGKYHLDCYEAMREAGPEKWPESPAGFEGLGASGAEEKTTPPVESRYYSRVLRVPAGGTRPPD